MSAVRSFGRFWWDFVVGDDWRLAVGVALTLAGVALLAHEAHTTAWWLLPLAVLVLLYRSLTRATR